MASGESPSTVGERLREALSDAGMSQRQLARELMGEDADDRQVENMRRQIARYLADSSAPEPERAARISQILGQPPDRFIDERATRARLAEEIRRLADGFDELRKAAEAEVSAAASEGSIDRRLRSLEDQVERQGKEMTKALRGATRRLGRIEELLGHPEHERERRAR